MHELNATKRIIKDVLETCKKYDVKQVSEIVVRVGILTSFEAEPIKYYFSTIKEEYPILTKAKLIILIEDSEIYCKTCKKENIIKNSYLMECPECGSDEVKIIKGQDVIIQEIKRGTK